MIYGRLVHKKLGEARAAVGADEESLPSFAVSFAAIAAIDIVLVTATVIVAAFFLGLVG